MYTKEVSITNDRSKYFCYKVHIVTADRQIGLMGVRRKFMPPDAARMQDLVFVLVGRKLKFFTKKEIDESDGVLKDEQFDPEEMQEFMVPLERIVVDSRHTRIHAKDCAECDTATGMVDRIERDITLIGPLDADQRARLLDIADRCPVHRTLRSEVSIHTAEAQADQNKG